MAANQSRARTLFQHVMINSVFWYRLLPPSPQQAAALAMVEHDPCGFSDRIAPSNEVRESVIEVASRRTGMSKEQYDQPSRQ
jgi:hypothetical protein